jgi:hypothetical protein
VVPLTRYHGHVALPQILATSDLHSARAASKLHPCCWQIVPSDPEALQNCTIEQPLAVVIAPPTRCSIDFAPIAGVSLDIANGSSSFESRAVLCAAISDDSPAGSKAQAYMVARNETNTRLLIKYFCMNPSPVPSYRITIIGNCRASALR